MSKIALVSPAIAVLFFASAAAAQVYYPQTYSSSYSYAPAYSSALSMAAYPSYTTPSYGGCVVLTTDLFYGMRNSQVTQLQRFLVSLGLPGSGNWMITGYFGSATQQAVRVFQQQSGLSMTGYVDGATRSAIQMRTCGYNTPTYPTYPTYPSYPTYPTYPTYPSYPTSCGYDYYYNDDCEEIEIDRLRPTSGEVGDRVTIEGSGFSSSGNTVYFDNYAIANVSSSDGETIRFTVPTYIGNSYQYGYGYSNYGTERVDEGSYSVYVRNAYGETSNSRTFRVTDDDDDNDDYLSIEIISGPSSLDEDEEGEWRVRIETPDNDTYTVTADWGDNSNDDIESVTGDRTLTFEHEYDQDGDYDIRFRISGSGESDTDTTSVDVDN